MSYWKKGLVWRLSNTQSQYFCGAYTNMHLGLWILGWGGLLGWISHFTGRLSNTQSLHFCGAFSNRYLDLGIWGGGVLLGWTGPFTGRLSDTQSQYFCGVLANWYLDLGTWGGGLLVMLTSSDRLTLPYMRSLYSWFSCACSLRFKCVSLWFLAHAHCGSHVYLYEIPS